MPTVRLSCYECRNNLFPRACAACGAPAGDSVRFAIPTRFLFYVVVPIVILFPPLCVAVVVYLDRTRPMCVPMCHRHRAEWRRWDRRMAQSYLTIVGGAFTAAVLLLAFVPAARVDAFLGIPHGVEAKWGLIPLGYYAIVMAWNVPVAIRQTRYVRITQATARDIRLSGVHRDFIRAVWDDRAQDPNSNRVAMFGDARDDYDDER